jgi:hypothetical protein
LLQVPQTSSISVVLLGKASMRAFANHAVAAID